MPTHFTKNCCTMCLTLNIKNPHPPVFWVECKEIRLVNGLRLKSVNPWYCGGDVHISYNILEDKFDALLFFIESNCNGHENTSTC